MNWELQAIPGRCECDDCTAPDIQPGEPVRLHRLRRQRWCWLCAWRRLQEKAPADLPVQFVPAIVPTPKQGGIYVARGRSVDPNFAPFDRSSMGGTLRRNILTRRQLEQVNRDDGKLKQLGGDR